MRRHCPVCRTPIPVKWEMCDKHMEFYKDHRPEWLQFLIEDDQRLLDESRYSKVVFVEYSDELDYTAIQQGHKHSKPHRPDNWER